MKQGTKFLRRPGISGSCDAWSPRDLEENAHVVLLYYRDTCSYTALLFLPLRKTSASSCIHDCHIFSRGFLSVLRFTCSIVTIIFSLEMACEKEWRAGIETQHGDLAISSDTSQPTSVLTSYLRKQTLKLDPLATTTPLAASKGARHDIREGSVPLSESRGSSSSEDSLENTPGLAGVIVSHLTRVNSSRVQHPSERAEKPAKDGSQHQIDVTAAAVTTTATAEQGGPNATLSETRQLPLPRPRGGHEPEDGRASLYSEVFYSANRVAEG